MSHRLKVGELFILGYEDDRLDILETFHSQFGLGGVILFARNTEDINTLRKRLTQIRDMTSRDILVAVDQEGGRVVRLSGMDFPVFQSPACFGEQHDLTGATHAASVTAQYLRESGINVNLNPVVDILTNPANELMSRRCYANNESDVCRYVEAIIKAQRSVRVASCAKHFPGLGDCNIDPHNKLAISDRPRDFFYSLNFKPFEAAIRLGCPIVMTTHLLARSLDSVNPATFSSKICKRILREDLGFEGVILSDDLDMGAVDSVENASVRALRAGHDAVLVCHSIDQLISCAESVEIALSDGTLDERAVVDSIERIRKLKSDFAI